MNREHLVTRHSGSATGTFASYIRRGLDDDYQRASIVVVISLRPDRVSAFSHPVVDDGRLLTVD
ncbi:MAG: hypothetical protein WA860_02355 [Acidimicrobiales bacterium]